MFEHANPRDITPADFDSTSSAVDRVAFIACHGLLAPSAHNSQPWQLDIGTSSLTVRADPDRRLPIADPDGRQACLSLGTFTKNVTQVARSLGAEVSVERGGTAKEPFVEISIGAAAHQPDDKLLRFIRERSNNRHPYEGTLPGGLDPTIETGGARIELLTSEHSKMEIADIVAQSMSVFLSDLSFRRELSSWVRNNYTRSRDGMPGYTHGVPGPVSLLFPFMVKHLNPSRMFAKRDRDRFSTSPGIGIVSVETDDPAHWLQAGEIYEEFALNATSLGLSTALSSAAIEDRAAREGIRTMAHGYHPVAVFRVGTPIAETRRSPRRTLAMCLRGSENRGVDHG